MTRHVHNALILVFAAAVTIAAGCQESQTPSEKKSRLIAAQNIELQKQLAQRDKQISNLKAQYAARIGLDQKKLAECRKQTANCREQLNKGMEEKVNEVLVASVEESAKIRAENAKLKAEIAELKAKLNQPKDPEKKE